MKTNNPSFSIICYLVEHREITAAVELTKAICKSDYWKNYSTEDKSILEVDFLRAIHTVETLHNWEMDRTEPKQNKIYIYEPAAVEMSVAFLTRDPNLDLTKEIERLKTQSKLSNKDDFFLKVGEHAIAIIERPQLDKIISQAK